MRCAWGPGASRAMHPTSGTGGAHAQLFLVPAPPLPRALAPCLGLSWPSLSLSLSWLRSRLPGLPEACCHDFPTRAGAKRTSFGEHAEFRASHASELWQTHRAFCPAVLTQNMADVGHTAIMSDEGGSKVDTNPCIGKGPPPISHPCACPSPQDGRRKLGAASAQLPQVPVPLLWVRVARPAPAWPQGWVCRFYRKKLG
jgi:hypothetical protein